MELIEKLRNILKTEYGISSDAELMEAVENMEELDIGIFVTRLGGSHEKQTA